LEQYAADVGSSWNRWDFHWSWVRREKEGVLGWYWEDESYSEGAYSYEGATSSNLSNPSLQIIGILNGGLPPASITGDTPYTPAGSWEAFVTQVISRYGDRINVWEVGNEEFIYETLTPEQYLAALDRTCEVVESLQGEAATVLLGSPVDLVGLSVANRAYEFPLGSEFQGTTEYIDILRDVAQSPTRRSCIDVIGLHPYYRPAWTWWTVTGVDKYLEEEYGWTEDQPEYWVTESGVQHKDNATCVEGKGPCVNDFVQASYIVQQYTMAKQAFAEASPDKPEGVVIHHRIRDHFADGTFGLLREDNNFRLPSYYATWLVTQVLGDATFGYEGSKDLSRAGYKHLVLTGREGNPIHVLWTTKPEVVTLSLTLLRSQKAELYHQGLAQSYYESKTDPQSITSGYELTLPGTTSATEGSGNDPYQDRSGNKNWDSNYFVGGETVIVVESSATPPEGEAAVICDDGEAVGTDLWGLDADDGLVSLSYACSPEKTYDLSWTEPGRTYAGRVDAAPGKKEVCLLTLTDQSGQMLTQTLTNPCKKEDPPGGSGDHLDFPTAENAEPTERSRLLYLCALWGLCGKSWVLTNAQHLTSSRFYDTLLPG